MANFTAQTTVTTSQTLLADGLTDTVGNNGFGVSFTNRGSVSVYLGPSGVSTGTGVELQAGESRSFWVGTDEKWYGITASSTARVDVAKVGA